MATKKAKKTKTTTTAKTSGPKKVAPQKVAPKQSPAKKAPAKKAPAKKAPAKKVAAKAKPAASVWTSTAAITAALAKGGKGLDETFDANDASHQKALLALPTEKIATLIAMIGGPGGLRRRFPNAVALLAQTMAMKGRGKDAIKLCDALIDTDHQEFAGYGVALWAVQNDNTHLGIDEKRVRHYVTRATKHGKKEPSIFYNAAFALLEIGDREGALKHLKAAVGAGFPKELARHQLATEKLAKPVRNDKRFLAAVQ